MFVKLSENLLFPDTVLFCFTLLPKGGLLPPFAVISEKVEK